MAANSPESEASNSADDLIKDTELTLRLPGEPSRDRERSGGGTKREYSNSLDLHLGSGLSGDHGVKEEGGGGRWSREEGEEEEASSGPKPPVAKAQLVGWPPVRPSRKNVTMTRASKYVKVAADGAPYLRKVNLRSYNSYEELLKALDDMFFSCFNTVNYSYDGKLMDRVNESKQCVPTYEDKDGDWMMVGDVPWKMFVESCKRLRLMKSSEAIGLAPGTPTN